MRQQDTTIARTKQGFWKVFLGLFHKTGARTNTPPCLAFVRGVLGGSLRKCFVRRRIYFFFFSFKIAFILRGLLD